MKRASQISLENLSEEEFARKFESLAVQELSDFEIARIFKINTENLLNLYSRVTGIVLTYYRIYKNRNPLEYNKTKKKYSGNRARISIRPE